MNTDRFRFPAEWEPQSGVMLTWPHGGTDWRPYLYAITSTYVELVRVISERENVVIAAQYADDVDFLLKCSLTKKQYENVSIYQCGCNDTWARDHGPITLKGEDGESLVLNFRFNGWGDKFKSDLDNAITGRLLQQKAFTGREESHDNFVLEGGSVECDGNGTVLTTSSCLLAPHRNQPLTKEQIASNLKTFLRAERIIWLDHGVLIGDDTDGHIDTIVRFAPDDTLLYVGCDDADDAQCEDFKALEKQLKQLKTTDGRPYKLVRLPMPRSMFDGEERLPANYANFLIINGAVVFPTYNPPDNDSSAAEAIAEAFPQRDVIGVDASTIIRQHGSIHCLTMQIPQ